jgi:DNA-binding MarR family transcriptional regulator
VGAEASLVEQLVLAQRHAVRGLVRALAEDGCTIDQWLVLRALGDGDGHAMGELASSLRMAQPTLTRVVDSLSDRALVYRRQDPDDGRRVDVHLSRQGVARLRRLESLVRAHEASLDADPAWLDVRRAVARLVL